MKKRYIFPDIRIIKMRPRVLLGDSGLIKSSDRYNLKYGGVDENGEYDPD